MSKTVVPSRNEDPDSAHPSPRDPTRLSVEHEYHPAGFVDRRALGAKLFSDPSIRARVEAALWPEVLALTIEDLNTAAKPGLFELRIPDRPTVQVPRGIAVIEAALLIEAGWHTRVDELWVTHVPEATAVTRIVERNHIPPEDARRRIQAQMTNTERLAHANFAVDTSRPIEETRKRLVEPWTRIVREVAEER